MNAPAKGENRFWKGWAFFFFFLFYKPVRRKEKKIKKLIEV